MSGCGYQGYEFGAGAYPDSICVDGVLFDADNCDDKGNLYVPTEEIPCPMCRPAAAKDYWADHNRRSGMPRFKAMAAARALVNDIINNRKNGTEPWKQPQPFSRGKRRVGTKEE